MKGIRLENSDEPALSIGVESAIIAPRTRRREFGRPMNFWTTAREGAAKLGICNVNNTLYSI